MIVSEPDLLERARRQRRWRLSRLWLALAATVATAAIVLLPQLHIVYASPASRVAVQTTSTLAGLLLAYLLFGRYLRTGRLDDLLLANAIGVGACGNAALLVFLAANLDSFGLSVWGPAAAQLVGGVGTAVAGLAPSRTLQIDRREAVRRSAAVWAGLIGLVAVLIVLLPHLPDLRPAAASGRVSLPLFAGALGVLAIQGALVASNAIGSIGFARKADQEGDEFAHSLSLALIVGTFARLNYMLAPSLYSRWVSPGDAFRLVFSALLLWAAAREIRSYWQGVSAAATLEERRRMARDLHDGLAQELAFISRRARRAAGEDGTLRQIAAAADRALVESRRAIAALSLPLDERFEVVLARTAEDIAARAGARLSMEVDPAVRVEREHAEALIRIVCEAVQNATRHGRADAVRLELRSDDGVCVRVHDNGCGFEQAKEGATTGFGLISMRERAGAIGGEFRIESTPGSGTTVEVRLA